MFGFADEVGGFVEVDVVGGGGAVGVDAGDGAVEDVVVAFGIGGGGVGARDAEDVAEFGEEHLVVGALGGSGILPAGDEGFDGFVWTMTHCGSMACFVQRVEFFEETMKGRLKIILACSYLNWSRRRLRGHPDAKPAPLKIEGKPWWNGGINAELMPV